MANPKNTYKTCLSATPHLRPELVPFTGRTQIAHLAIGWHQRGAKLLPQLRLESNVTKGMGAVATRIRANAPLLVDARKIIAGAVHPRGTCPSRFVALARGWVVGREALRLGPQHLTGKPRKAVIIRA